MGRRTPRADWPPLDPCPWCGLQPKVGDGDGSMLYLWRNRGGSASPWWVTCGRCRAQGPHARYRKGAVEAWNSRRGAP